MKKKRVKIEYEFEIGYEDKRHLERCIKDLLSREEIHYSVSGCGFLGDPCDEGPFSYHIDRTKKKGRLV